MQTVEMTADAAGNVNVSASRGMLVEPLADGAVYPVVVRRDNAAASDQVVMQERALYWADALAIQVRECEPGSRWLVTTFEPGPEGVGLADAPTRGVLLRRVDFDALAEGENWAGELLDVSRWAAVTVRAHLPGVADATGVDVHLFVDCDHINALAADSLRAGTEDMAEVPGTAMVQLGDGLAEVTATRRTARSGRPGTVRARFQVVGGPPTLNAGPARIELWGFR
ncbi:hypothetical protein BO221_04855 [Archangium sp. Cb G35]|uniref:hypothetical protein n=1 Tax=Archangium sp. Cb G35 TaxID=1920190 RepID=UPI0009369C67|nr:hypothetical protein [Archangium sp. Cb G35]OJT27317.1 hypothetical protein BO221_04855 [Archangium sp. Cb G35]